MKRIKSVILWATIFFTSSSLAYRQDVHMLMTDYVANQSVLGNEVIWAEWGVDRSSEFSYRPVKTKFNQYAPSTLNFTNLLKYGVDGEDENVDVNSVFNPDFSSRAYDHFYNPQSNEKLSVWYTGQKNYTSPDWMLEGLDSPAINTQNFSYADAQFYFYSAFAGETVDQRNANMGRMFQALGHVVHHIQDMAQPEHTRLDPHCDAEECLKWYARLGDDDSSQYEQFTQDLLNCGALVYAADTSLISCPNVKGWNGNWMGKKINIGGYSAPVVFSTPRDYWHNVSGSGIADFSSTNFITNDTSFVIASAPLPFDKRLLPASVNLPLPAGSDTFISQSTLGNLLPSGQLGSLEKYKNSKMTFVGIHAKDKLTQQTIDISQMATFSIFNERMQVTGTTHVLEPYGFFSTNNFNLEQWASNLLPRAVGYSIGLINHFFRIRLKVSVEPSLGTDAIKVKNNSAYDFSGQLRFFYDDEYGIRHFHSSVDANLLAGKSTQYIHLEVGASKKPTKNFYVIAVENGTDHAVAVRPFQYDAEVSDSSSSSSSSSSTNLVCNRWFKSDNYSCNLNPPHPGWPCTEGGVAIPGGTWGRTTTFTVNMGSTSGDVLLLYAIYPSASQSGAKVTVYGGGTQVSKYVDGGNYWNFGSGWAKTFYYDASLSSSRTVTISVEKSEDNIPFTVGIGCPSSAFEDVRAR